MTSQAIKFGTDGVRGKAGDWPINTAGALTIGRGIGGFLMGKDSPRVVIGRDTRLSGDMLSAALTTGLLEQGIDVVDVGVIPTAGVAYLTKAKGMDAGIMISASHNPWQENGIKVINADGGKLSAEQEKALEAAINQEHEGRLSGDFGRMQYQPEWVDDYIDHLVGPFAETDFSDFHIVVDCSHGAASGITAQCFERLGCQATVIHDQPDGKNINHQAGSEVVRAGTSILKDIMLENKADCAAAFDGDSDRLVMLDHEGNLIDGDHLLYVLGRYLKESGNLPGDVVVTTQMANRGLDQALSEIGCETIRTSVGDKYILREIKEKGYILGGEQSGHIIIYDETHTTGDGIYSTLYVANIIVQAGKSLKELADPVVKFPQVIASARVGDKPPLEGIESFLTVRDQAAALLGEESIINTRYSGTESLIRVMIEGTAAHTLDDVARQAVLISRAVQDAAGGGERWIDVKNLMTGASIDLSEIED